MNNIRLCNGDTTLGRMANSNILVSTSFASRNHCQISVSGEHIRINDVKVSFLFKSTEDLSLVSKIFHY